MNIDRMMKVYTDSTLAQYLIFYCEKVRRVILLLSLILQIPTEIVESGISRYETPGQILVLSHFTRRHNRMWSKRLSPLPRTVFISVHHLNI